MLAHRQLTEQTEDVKRSKAQELAAAAHSSEAALSRAKLVEERCTDSQQEADRLKGQLGEERSKLAQVVSEKGSLQTQSTTLKDAVAKLHEQAPVLPMARPHCLFRCWPCW